MLSPLLNLFCATQMCTALLTFQGHILVPSSELKFEPEDGGSMHLRNIHIECTKRNRCFSDRDMY
jgi:hypothetical protein